MKHCIYGKELANQSLGAPRLNACSEQSYELSRSYMECGHLSSPGLSYHCSSLDAARISNVVTPVACESLQTAARVSALSSSARISGAFAILLGENASRCSPARPHLHSPARPCLGPHFFSATCPFPFSILFKSYLFIYICLFILRAFIYVCIPRAFLAWCPWRPEEDIGSPASGDADGSELPCGIQTRFWKSSQYS